MRLSASRVLQQPVRGHVHQREVVSTDQTSRGDDQGLAPFVLAKHVECYTATQLHPSANHSHCLSCRRSGSLTGGLNGGGKPSAGATRTVS